MNDGCEFWPDGTPCGAPAVETLVFCNPNICDGEIRVCADCLSRELRDHLLDPRGVMLKTCPACSGRGIVRGKGRTAIGGFAVPFHDCQTCQGKGELSATSLLEVLHGDSVTGNSPSRFHPFSEPDADASL